MRRRHLSPKDRTEIFSRENGICHFCNGKIIVGESWDISHEIPLELGGDDYGSNLRVAHHKCHRDYTAKKDIPTIAKVKRIEAKHRGIRKRSKFACSKDSPFKKKISGEVVRR
jgi:5-methylcytosine-specific restriction enzyme A